MKKSLSQRIAERVALQKPTARAKNRAAFLANKNDISEAMADGWSVKKIWETLHDEKKITFSYQAFTKYVNSLVKTPKQVPVVETKGTIAPTTTAQAAVVQPEKDKKEFRFNSQPNPKELL